MVPQSAAMAARAKTQQMSMAVNRRASITGTKRKFVRWARGLLNLAVKLPSSASGAGELCHVTQFLSNVLLVLMNFEFIHKQISFVSIGYVKTE
jgi:hypothetical protein